jgi:hypothetical protein
MLDVMVVFCTFACSAELGSPEFRKYRLFCSVSTIYLQSDLEGVSSKMC